MIAAALQTGWLALLAAATLAFAVLVYVLLDGTDLGVGILFAMQRDSERRELMVDTILPVWDGNETWIVLGGGGLIAMFPTAYGILLPALYPVFLMMLLALIFRGVAIEFREHGSERGKRRWDVTMFAGSLLAACAQGILLGALVQGIRVANGAYAGGRWDWLTPFTCFCGAGLAIGYGWLGACWLIWRTSGELQAQARRAALPLGVLTLLCTSGVAAWTPLLDASYASRWFVEYGVLPSVAAAALFALLAAAFVVAVRRERHFAPLAAALGWFVVAFGCVLFTIFPSMLPPSLSIAAAASPPETEAFVLGGSAFLIPAILAYSTFAFWVFRGKVPSNANTGSEE